MFLNGITVVLAGNEEFVGATIAWATKVEKQHVLVSLPAEAAVTNRILQEKTFTISVLASHQSDIARQYGGRKQARPLPQNRNDLDFTLWATPVVKNCRAQLLCSVQQINFIKEQVVIIAKIDQATSRDDVAPLIYDHKAYFD
ncbi:MAG: flavin reductase family protein [Chloroflexota bacterium]